MVIDELREENEKIAEDILRIARDSLLINLRFLDTALLRLPFEKKDGLRGFATDGEHLYYDPIFVLRLYASDEHMISRICIHSLMHCIFNHSFNYDKLNQKYWDIACDIAIENLIMELDISALSLKDDDRRVAKLRGLKKNVQTLTAQKIYRHFLVNELAFDDANEYEELFARDLHIYFSKTQEYEVSLEQWKRISERIKTDLKAFSKTSGNSEDLIKNLVEATRERVDYKDYLGRFLRMGEESTVNDEEFDYIYYTYGMTHYKNMPLVEPLEYKDVKKIKDFAIVIDTSASCQGKIVKRFLEETYNIMRNSENFFNTINVHIIQCDNEIQSDTIITRVEDFQNFIENGKLKGFGGTDFRPAFEYVDKLIIDQEFENFKGMIYFTDGYGVFPENAPDYDVLFVFMADKDRAPSTPWWVIKLELQEEDLMEG